jgi:hypothetical protein
VLELPVIEDSREGGKTKLVYRYYQIPSTISAEPATVRLMRNGKKLHLHNMHTFVAVKPKG